MTTTLLTIGGMSCGSCVRHVTRALEGMSGVAHVEVDLAERCATVTHDDEAVDSRSLVLAVEDAGYTAFVRSA